VSSRSGVATLRTAIHFCYLLTYLLTPVRGNYRCVEDATGCSGAIDDVHVRRSATSQSLDAHRDVTVASLSPWRPVSTAAAAAAADRTSPAVESDVIATVTRPRPTTTYACDLLAFTENI